MVLVFTALNEMVCTVRIQQQHEVDMMLMKQVSLGLHMVTLIQVFSPCDVHQPLFLFLLSV